MAEKSKFFAPRETQEKTKKEPVRRKGMLAFSVALYAIAALSFTLFLFALIDGSGNWASNLINTVTFILLGTTWLFMRKTDIVRDIDREESIKRLRNRNTYR